MFKYFYCKAQASRKIKYNFLFNAKLLKLTPVKTNSKPKINF